MNHRQDPKTENLRPRVFAISLVVLRCNDVAATQRFYESFGVVFQTEKHGAGPQHCSCRVGDTVLELYPASPGAATTVARLGLSVASVSEALRTLDLVSGRVHRPFDASTGTAVVIDPDGTKVELSEPPSTGVVPSSADWTVWRQDDNGNQFRISGGHTREEAERLCGEFEVRGHKQLYWVSPNREGAG
jgi:catechol 2,3-dioxygenase-like lactoylglutathione lyase family enzyme